MFATYDCITAIIKSFLPVWTMSETSFKVKIFHETEVHRSLCQMESQAKAYAEHTEPCCLLSKVCVGMLHETIMYVALSDYYCPVI